MKPVRIRSKGVVILYDADLIDKIDSEFFEPDEWHRRNAVIGEARGRGSAWIVRHGDRELVLRHYRRGGFFGPWLGDKYLWIGADRSRALREWNLLAALHARGLPVPRPVAARVCRQALIYRADLVTERIAAAESLAQKLAHEPIDTVGWRAIGQCVRRFHAEGVCHADLNAHNVLLAANKVYLIDFDRGRQREPGSWQFANLARLRRSLNKLAAETPQFAFGDAEWKKLEEGYASAGQSSDSAST